MNDEQITLSGQVNLARNGEGGFLHRLTLAIAPGVVKMTAEGFGPDCRPHEPVISTHPAVEQYARAVDHALQVTAYRNRQVTPIPKPPKRGRRLPMPELCRVCGNRPGEVEMCDECDGTGLHGRSC